MSSPTSNNHQPASIARRCSAALVDGACLAAIVGSLLTFFYGRAYFDPEYLRLMPNYASFLTWASLLPAAVVIFFWLLWRNTPGKALLNLVIVDQTSGSAPNRFQFLKRLAGYYLCTATLGLGFLVALFQTNRQGLHDKIAGTLVLGPAADRSEPSASRESSTWLPLFAALANLAVGALVYFSPIGVGNGNGVIGYSIYRGLILLLLNLPLAATGIVAAVAIGIATDVRRAVPGILTNIAAGVGVLAIYYFAEQ